MSAWGNFMSDLTGKDSAAPPTLPRDISTLTARPAVSWVRSLAAIDVSGNYNASSTSDFLRELSEHASSSNHCAEMGSRAASSLSIGEVQTRTHTQGSEESFRVVIS